MENQQTEQIKTETKKDTKESIEYVSNEIKTEDKIDISEITGLFQSASAIPTTKPTSTYGQLFVDSANNKAYFYDGVKGSWFSVGSTPVLQYQTTLTEDNNTSDGVSTTYTQTINCGFTPHTVIFNGYLYKNGNHTIDGMALKNDATTTTGSCRYIYNGYQSAGVSTTHLGDVFGEDYITVSTWGTNGITISKRLVGYYAGCKMGGVLILIG